MLYIPFYVVKRFLNSRSGIFVTLAVTAIVGFAYYVFVLDKSVYAMNDVTNPITLFLYFSAMLVGALFKKLSVKYRGATSWLGLGMAFILFIAYMVVYVVISGNTELFNLQIIINIVLLLATAVMFISIISLEKKIRKLPKPILSVIWFIAMLTLELYVVQRVIIEQLENIVFPLNLALIALAVVAAAALLHIVTGTISRWVNKIIK